MRDVMAWPRPQVRCFAGRASPCSVISHYGDGTCRIHGKSQLPLGTVLSTHRSTYHGKPMTRVVPQGRGTEHSPVVLLDGSGALPRTVLGSKGYGIDAMRRHGLPVPPAFAVTTEVGARLVADPQGCLEGIWDQVRDKMRRHDR